MASSYALNARYINPFLDSTMRAVMEMGDFDDVTPECPILKENKHSEGFLTGIIHMNGAPLFGSYAITFSDKLIVNTCSELFVRELRKGQNITVLARDLVAEIARIACGRAKMFLQKEGYTFQLQPARTLVGEHHEIEHKTSAPVIQIPFMTSKGEFYVETSFCKLVKTKAQIKAAKPTQIEDAYYKQAV